MGKLETEDKIVQAATEEFIERGLEGGRMRNISQRAGVNKGLIHYYFKSKEVLFARVFEVTFGVLMSKLNAAMGKDEHLFDMIRSFTSIHIDTVQKNARLPRFIVSELGRNPERMIKLIDNSKEFDIRKKFEKAVREAVMLDEIIEIDPNQLFSNMLSMCIFPFLGRPMIQFALTMDDKEFKAFIDKRKTEVAEFIIRSIQKK